MIDTQKRNKRQYEWQRNNTDRLNFTMEKGTKDRIKAAADKLQMKPSEFCRLAITEKIDSIL